MLAFVLLSYLMTIPAAAVVQSKPGTMLAANYVVADADVVPSLGRSLSGNATNVTVVLTDNPTFVPGRTWMELLTILTPRGFRITAEMNF
jgi:hypothetical protein